METINIKLEDIIPYKNNAKKHNRTQINNVAESIKQFGMVQPLVLDKNNEIVIGHCRYEALKKLGEKEAPCVMADDLTEEQIKKLRNLDNKLNESEWDYDLLKFDIEDLDFSDFDIDWEIPDLDFEEKETEEDDFDIELPVEPKSKLGDIYQLGNHRLMCGDSTSIDDVEKLMDGNKADMVFTDPPYGMIKQAEGVLNDNLNYDDLLKFNKKWIPLTFKFTKDNGSWYCWGINEPLMDIYSNILKPMQKESKITFRNLITWNKYCKQNPKPTSIKMMRNYCIYDEKCLFVQCGVQGISNNYFERWEPIRQYLVDEWSKISSKNDWDEYLNHKMGIHYFLKSQWVIPTEEKYKELQELGEKFGAFKKEYDEIKKEYDATIAYFDNTHETYMTAVWDFETTSKEEREFTGGHPTPKPIALCSRAIKSSSRENEIVLDVFGGSGSTLIACEQLNRNCYMMELNPKYVDVIIERWEQYTGKKAVLLNE